MKVSRIVHLESYRSRKALRLRKTLALYGHDPERSRIVMQIWRAITLVGADRGAVIWLDEYGPGLSHTYGLLDLAFDRPRRIFSPIPLRAAWDAGVPGLLDMADATGRLGRDADGVRSVSAVALGSDGPRSWFLCLDSLTPRPPLGEDVAGELMFVAGECASLLLHKDLDGGEVRGAAGSGLRVPNSAGEPFAGWPVLNDIEGRRDDVEAGARIATRFLVARVVRGLVDDDLVVSPDALGYQVTGVRKEFETNPVTGPERKVWERVLAAIELLDQDELLGAVLEWGGIVEAMGHFSGALEIHDLAYELAVAAGSGEAAVDAARFKGRVHRKLAQWEDSIRWYGVAEAVAREIRSVRKLSAVLDGKATAFRDRGKLPKAREILREVLELGLQESDRYSQALAHHSLMTVEKEAGELEAAVLHGWQAVECHEAQPGRLFALFDLAGVFRKRGELAPAWDAYTVVAAQVDTFEYKILSLDAMALIAALRGQGSRYDALRARVDGMGWDGLGASAVVQAQVLLYRGISCLALERGEEGEAWLKQALAFAEEHKLSKLIFDAEAALKRREPLELARDQSSADGPDQDADDEVAQVRQNLQEMREALAGAGAGAL